MLIYYLLFAFICLLAIPLLAYKPTKTKKIIYVCSIFFAFFLLCVFRYGIGNDYFTYYQIFHECADLKDFAAIQNSQYEIGFVILNKIISIFVNNIFSLYVVYAIIIFVPSAYVVCKYSKNPWISCMLYMCLTFLCNSMNFIRQTIAASIILLAYGFIMKRKTKEYDTDENSTFKSRFLYNLLHCHIPVLLISVIAASFHYTAFIFIPLYLISLIKPNAYILGIYGCMNICGFIGCTALMKNGKNPMDMLAKAATKLLNKNFESYIDTKYFKYGLSQSYLYMPFILIAFVLAAYFLGWQKEKESHILLNFMVLSTSFWLFSTKIFILERFSMFIFIFVILAVASIANHFLKSFAEISRCKKNEDKSDFQVMVKSKKQIYCCLLAFITIGSFVYHDYGMQKNFHGVYPYQCNIQSIEKARISTISDQELYNELTSKTSAYKFALLLKESGFSFIMTSDAKGYASMDSITKKAFEELGIDTSFADENTVGYIGVYDGESFTDYQNSASVKIGKRTFNINCSQNFTSAVENSTGAQYAVDRDGVHFIVLDKNGSRRIHAVCINFTSYKQRLTRLSSTTNTTNSSIIKEINSKRK